MNDVDTMLGAQVEDIITAIVLVVLAIVVGVMAVYFVFGPIALTVA